MATSTSDICLLVIILGMIVCLSMLVGLKSFAPSTDDHLLREAERYASTFSNKEHYDDMEEDLEAIGEEDEIHDEALTEESMEEFASVPSTRAIHPATVVQPATAVHPATTTMTAPVSRTVVARKPHSVVADASLTTDNDIHAFDGAELQAFSVNAVM